MKAYTHLLEAYRNHPSYYELESQADEMARTSTESDSACGVKLVQTYRAPSARELDNLSSKKREKAIAGFYRNIIVPRRVILHTLYTRECSTSMEAFCTFLSGAESYTYYDSEKNIWGCTKLKKILQILGFAYNVQAQHCALQVLGLPMSKKGVHLTAEESKAIQMHTPARASISEHQIATHIARLEKLQRPHEALDYLRDSGILENKALLSSLTMHFLDSAEQEMMPRFSLF